MSCEDCNRVFVCVGNPPLEERNTLFTPKKTIWYLSLPPVFKIINIAWFLSKDRFIKMAIFEGE